MKLHQIANKKTQPLSQATLKYVNYFNVSLPDQAQDLAEAKQEYTELLIRLFKKYQQRKKTFVEKSVRGKATEMEKFREREIMASRYGMPVREKQGKALRLHVFGKLAEKSTDELSDSESQKQPRMRRNLTRTEENKLDRLIHFCDADQQTI